MIMSVGYTSHFLANFHYNYYVFLSFYKTITLKFNPLEFSVVDQTKDEVEIAEIFDDNGLDDLKKEYEMMKHFTKDNLIDFQNRFFLIFIYSEMEQYFFRTLKFTILKHPKIIKEKQIKIDSLLKKRNIDLIIEEKAEDTIKDLLFKDFSTFFEILSKKPYGFNIQLDDNEINDLDKFNQLRNAYIHGDGLVSLIYLSKIKDSGLKLGEKLPLNEEILIFYFRLVSRILRKFDQELILKFPELETMGDKWIFK